jgi:hypothetical protein
MEEPKPKEIYRHFKGGRYEIITLARDSENPNAIKVIYQALDFSGNPKNERPWSRNLEDFCGDKIFDKSESHNGKLYQKGDKIKRFTKILDTGETKNE